MKTYEVRVFCVHTLRDHSSDFDFLIIYEDHTWDGIKIDNWGDLKGYNELRLQNITQKHMTHGQVYDYLKSFEKEHKMEFTAI